MPMTTRGRFAAALAAGAWLLGGCGAPGPAAVDRRGGGALGLHLQSEFVDLHLRQAASAVEGSAVLTPGGARAEYTVSGTVRGAELQAVLRGRGGGDAVVLAARCAATPWRFGWTAAALRTARSCWCGSERPPAPARSGAGAGRTRLRVLSSPPRPPHPPARSSCMRLTSTVPALPGARLAGAWMLLLLFCAACTPAWSTGCRAPPAALRGGAAGGARASGGRPWRTTATRRRCARRWSNSLRGCGGCRRTRASTTASGAWRRATLPARWAS